jgi:hypothetical protein
MCMVSVQTFDRWVREGILPGPIPGTRRWSRLGIERALVGETARGEILVSPFEKWKRGSAR